MENTLQANTREEKSAAQIKKKKETREKEKQTNKGEKNNTGRLKEWWKIHYRQRREEKRAGEMRKKHPKDAK